MPFAQRLALAALLVCGLAAPMPAHAATPPAAPPVLGVVRDSAGHPLPNVRITVGPAGRSTLSGADGSFAIRALRAGTYHLDATLIGYAPAHLVVRVPESGEPVRVEIVMQVTPLALEGINVTAASASADALSVTQSTAELSGKALTRNLGASVAQTLSREPGMSMRYNGPAAATPVIRGMSGERVLVVENGQRTGDLSATSPDHGLSVDPLAASRIEVVRGPAALLYGNNALGGVVNIIASGIPTSVPSRLEGYVGAQGESVNPGGAGVGELTLPLGESVALMLRGGARRVGDVRAGGGDALGNSYARNAYGDVGVGYVSERVSGGVAASLYGFNYGLPASLHGEEEGGEAEGHGAGVHLEGRRASLKARTDVALGERGLTGLRADGSGQWYTHDEVEPNGEVGTSFRLDTQTLGLTAQTRMGRVSGALGASGLFKQYQATGEEALTPGANSNSAGVFVFQEVPMGGAPDHAPRLQLGARYDRYRIRTEAGDEKFGPARERSFGALSGSIGVSVPFGRQSSLGVSAARAFRAPTVEELFSDGFHAAVGSYDIGDPELDAEVNQGVEAVLRVQSRRLNLQVAGYYNRIDDYITPAIVGTTEIEDEEGATVTVPLNRFRQADARLAGAEGSIEAAVGGNFAVGAMGDVVRGSFVAGDPLPYMPAARLGGSLRWDDGRFSAGLEARRALAQRRSPQPELRTAAYTLLNLDVGLNRIVAGRVHTVALRADNLLDERYRDAASRTLLPSPGRNLALVYRVLF